MEITLNTFNNSKNKKRLIAQNHKLYQQIVNIHAQIKLFQPQQTHVQESSQTIVEKPLLEEITLQKKLIKKLKGQIQQYKLQRAKDNVEYIIRQEDELKIAKKLEFQLMDEKKILLNKKADKNIFLQKEVPYHNYEKQFLQNLTEVVHFNREQAAKITQIEREIRRYHLINKTKNNSTQKVHTTQNLQTISKEIQERVVAKLNLQRQWKPHLLQLDEQNASLLRQLAIKKQELAVMEKQQKSWEIRLSAIRQSEDVINDKERLQKVIVNPKLRQKILDYLQKQQEKKKKKVNEDQLKYQFVNKKNQQQIQDDAKARIGPPLPGMKKKDEKVIETMHNDKNISKKIDKSTAKKQKNDQNTLTQISVPSSKQTVNKIVRRDSLGSAIKSKLNNEQRTPRYWQSESPSQVQSQRGQEKTSKKNTETSNLLLKLKEIGITTEPKLWDGQVMQSVVQ